MDEPLSGEFARRGPVGKRFVHLESVARGGMGEVSKALDTTLDRVVALKRPLPDVVGAEARLRREAAALAGLDHPGIVRVLEAGFDPTGFRLVLPWLDGPDLPEVLDASSAPGHLLEVAEALAHAHGRGLVHRDVKPSNIRLHRGHAVLLDWGLAQLGADDPRAGERLTRTGVGLGTPGFMAPEQALGGVVDARSDVWSLGAMLRSHLTGEPPPSPEEVLANPLSDLGKGPLHDLARRCLQREPSRRPADAGAVARALREILAPPPSPRRTRWVGPTLVGLAIGLSVAGPHVHEGSNDAPHDHEHPSGLAAEAMIELAWIDARAGRTEQARAWGGAAARLLDSPATRGLSMLPALPTPTTTALGCTTGSFSPGGERLLCIGDEVRWIEASTGRTLWQRAFDGLSLHRAYADGAAMLADGRVLFVDDSGSVADRGSLLRATHFALHDDKLLAHNEHHSGKQPINGPVVLDTPTDARIWPVWEPSREAWLTGRWRDLLVIDPDTLALEPLSGPFAHEDLAALGLVGDRIVTVGMRGEITVLDRSGSVLDQQSHPEVGLLSTWAIGPDSVATSSPASGVLVWDLASQGLVRQVATATADALAFDGTDLLMLADGNLSRIPLAGVEPWSWGHPHLSTIGLGPAGELAAVSAHRLRVLGPEPASVALPEEKVVKGLTLWQDQWVFASVLRRLHVLRDGAWQAVGPDIGHRGVLALADDYLLGIPYDAGPNLIDPSGTTLSHLFHPSEEFMTAVPSADGRQVGLVTYDGDACLLGIPENAPPTLERVSSASTRWYAVPTDAGLLHIGPHGGSIERGVPLWTSDAVVTSVAIDARERCALGHRDGTVALRDCRTGRLLAELAPHEEIVSFVGFGAGETLLTASWDERVRRFDLEALHR